MTGAHVRDTQLRDCDLANADLRDARLRRVEVHGGRLTGAVLIGADLGELLIEDCRADLATLAAAELHNVQLAAAELHNVRLASCDLRSTDWQEAQLRAVCFEDCDLSGADLSRGRFVDVELRGCRLDGIRGDRRAVRSDDGGCVTWGGARRSWRGERRRRWRGSLTEWSLRLCSGSGRPCNEVSSSPMLRLRRVRIARRELGGWSRRAGCALVAVGI